MCDRRITLSTFVDERTAQAGGDLAALLDGVQQACKAIAAAVGRGVLTAWGVDTDTNVQGEAQKALDVVSNDLMLHLCEASGAVCGMVSEEMEHPYELPPARTRGRYLLIFDPLDGSSNIDVGITVGTIFSVLRAPAGVSRPEAADFLQRGSAQVAAGYALYGPTAMLILTLGDGVFGFTLDREADAYVLTHPRLRITESTREFAINMSNERFWEPPVHRYVSECTDGRTGPRGVDFNMRWVASMVAEVHRILIRGGLFMYPRDMKDPIKPGRLRLLYEANPMAMIAEQAGGAASTGRRRILDLEPASLHQRVPVILGSRIEVERLVDYHEAYDRGEPVNLASPLFNTRSLFRTA